jgi:hypothetical protein
MQTWYDNLDQKQKIYLFGLSVVLIVAWGVGLIGLAILVFLQLGAKEPLAINWGETKRAPKPGDPDYLDWANREGRYKDRD